LFKFLLSARYFRRLAGPSWRYFVRRWLWGRWRDRVLNWAGWGWRYLWLRFWFRLGFRFRIDDRNHLNIHHLDLRFLLLFKEFGHNRLALGFSFSRLGLLIGGGVGWRGKRLGRGILYIG
jgi:hypothetical protein